VTPAPNAAGDNDVATRALWMLARMGRPRLNATEIERARALIVRAAMQEEFLSYRGWIVRFAQRFWSEEWGQELGRVATGEDPVAAATVLALLHRLPAVAFDDEDLATLRHGRARSVPHRRPASTTVGRVDSAPVRRSTP
jgi:hypothetical protein